MSFQDFVPTRFRSAPRHSIPPRGTSPGIFSTILTRQKKAATTEAQELQDEGFQGKNFLPHVESIQEENMSVEASIHEEKKDESGNLIPAPLPSARRSLQTRSTYYQLTVECQHFQKIVTDLEGILGADATTSPEMAWRAQILIRSGEDMGEELAVKLKDYDESLKNSGSDDNDDRVRKKAARSACTKLHRDFLRSRRALEAVLAAFLIRQKADVSSLGAKQFKAIPEALTCLEMKNEDFYERAMREREEELGRMNRRMHQVNEIYQRVATLVDGQQEKIDMLDDSVRYAKENVESGVAYLNCFSPSASSVLGHGNWGTVGTQNPTAAGASSTHAARRRVNCSEGVVPGVQKCWGDLGTPEEHFFQGCGAFDMERITATSLNKPVYDPADIKRHPGIRVTENFHWFMPFETICNDMNAVRLDVVELLERGRDRFVCGYLDAAKEVTYIPVMVVPTEDAVEVMTVEEPTKKQVKKARRKLISPKTVTEVKLVYQQPILEESGEEQSEDDHVGYT